MTPKPPSRPPAAAAVASLPLWAATCFFASGAAGLLYEVIWSKQLGYLLGNSLHAVATVVAAFLAGLALGARLLGVPLSRRADGGRVYAMLELGVGLLGVVSLPVLRGLDPLVGQWYRAFGGETIGFGFARFALLFALLVPPAALMGATLPVLVGTIERRLVGPALARLYALNTFGAVAGSVAGGFALLPGLGLTRTAWFAAALNAAVAALAWVASSRRPAAAALDDVAATPAMSPATSRPPDAAATRESRPLIPAGTRTLVAVFFGLSGLAALVFQIAWVRLFALTFGSSVYSFSAVLGTYLLGLAIGSAVVARWMKRGVSLAGFGWLQVGIAAAAALMLQGFPNIPQWIYDLATKTNTSWFSMFSGELGITAAFILVPCALLGAVFPVAVRLLQQRDGGHAAGFGYAVNTAGTIAGSLAGGFLLVPRLGVKGAHLAALFTTLAVGVAALVLAFRANARGKSSRKGPDIGPIAAAGAVVVIVLLVIASPRWDPTLMSSGFYRPIQAHKFANLAANLPAGTLKEQTNGIERVLFYREGINGSVLVGTDQAGTDRWLRVDGKIDASTGDVETMVLTGLLPAALADSGARTLLIGMGSGMSTAGALAGGAGPTEVIEIEPAVVEASAFFHAPGQDPNDDPRVHVILGDARTRLLHGAGRYGLIVSQPSNPWIAGVNNLFTVDFYRRVKARLEPRGVFCQWLQLYEISPRTFASLAASIAEVFPDAQLFSIWANDDILIVVAPPDRAFSATRLRAEPARRLLQRSRIADAAALSAYYCGSVAGLRDRTRGADLNVDDRPIVEYRAPRDMFTIGRDLRVQTLLPWTDEPSRALFREFDAAECFTAGTSLLLSRDRADRVELLARRAEATGLAPVAAMMRAQVAADRGRREADRLVADAQSMVGSGRHDTGRQLLEQVTQADPTNGRAWVLLGDLCRMMGDAAGARAALAHVLSSTDTLIRVEAELVAGSVEVDLGQAAAAGPHFREAIRWGPRLPRSYLFPAEERLDARDPKGSMTIIDEGLAAIPGDPTLNEARRRLLDYRPPAAGTNTRSSYTRSKTSLWSASPSP